MHGIIHIMKTIETHFGKIQSLNYLYFGILICFLFCFCFLEIAKHVTCIVTVTTVWRTVASTAVYQRDVTG